MASFLVDSPEALEDMPASVGLLNIGTELGKGTDVLQETYQLLSNDSRFRFVGFVEANAIFSGECDVIVCDGFHGNIALKASEGTARFITDKIQSTLKSGWFGRLGLLLAWPFLKKLRRSLDPSEYNGASFLGLKKTLVKSHGDANEKAFLQAIKVAHEQALSNIPQRINLSLG